MDVYQLKDGSSKWLPLVNVKHEMERVYVPFTLNANNDNGLSLNYLNDIGTQEVYRKRCEDSVPLVLPYSHIKWMGMKQEKVKDIKEWWFRKQQKCKD